MEAAPAGIWRGLLFLEVPVREKGDKKGPSLDCFFFPRLFLFSYPGAGLLHDLDDGAGGLG